MLSANVFIIFIIIDFITVNITKKTIRFSKSAVMNLQRF